MDDDDNNDGDGTADNADHRTAPNDGEQPQPTRQKTKPHNNNNHDGEAGVAYNTLYQKAVEDFICSSEMGFRGLLKEFLDHEMVVARRDGAGGEVLGTPFRREELEVVLEGLI